MSASRITGATIDISQLLQNIEAARSSSSGSAAKAGQGGASFLSSLKLRMAEFQSQSFSTLMSLPLPLPLAGASGQSATGIEAIFGGDTAANPIDALFNPSGMTSVAGGRNTALFDPESGYRMMTVINAKDANHKAEFAEMSAMKSYLASMQEEGLRLGGIDSATGNDDIRARLKGFADAYNGWIARFDQDLQPGGLLAGTQAAQVSQWELEQSVANFFNGATAGLHGMRDLGFGIDAVTNLASVDVARLDAVLATNKAGAIATVREFSANFAKSAELLNSDGNFIANRLDNLDRVIDYVGNHRASLQAEFGRGDAAQPAGYVAQALASYNAIYGLSG